MKRLASEAVILMAGSGSRLRSSGENSRKPLVALAGRPLISYTFDALAKVGFGDDQCTKPIGRKQQRFDIVFRMRIDQGEST